MSISSLCAFVLPLAVRFEALAKIIGILIIFHQTLPLFDIGIY